MDAIDRETARLSWQTLLALLLELLKGLSGNVQANMVAELLAIVCDDRRWPVFADMLGLPPSTAPGAMRATRS